MPPSPTALLERARGGDAEAREAFVRQVYDELHRLAQVQRRRVGPLDTVNTTALVHEAYEKLMGRPVEWQDRRHFFGFAARAMRDVLVDYARTQSAAKRGGRGRPASLDPDAPLADDLELRHDEVIGLDLALQRLEAFDPEAARVVELRYFAGLSVEEVAELMELSQRTVKRRWTAARAWLHQALTRSAAAPDLS